MADADLVLDAIDGRGVATLRLNRPAVGNAYNAALIDGLIEVLARLARDQRVRVLVVRGAGRHFQAGADLAFLQGLATGAAGENLRFSRQTIAAIEALRNFPHPSVAVIQGGCFGGGVGIAAACDIALAAEDAMFAISEVRWGITAAPIIPLLTARLGPRALARWALGGQRFGAGEALRIGLVHEVRPAAALEMAAASAIDELLRAAPDAAAMTKQLIAEALETGQTHAARERIAAEASSRRTLAEAAEGFASFAEKRDPAWYPGGAGQG